MRRLMIVTTALLASFATAVAARAQTEPGHCDDGDFIEQAVAGGAEAYRVVVAGRSYFHGDGEGCPKAAVCQLKSYVIGKNRVLVGKVEKGWACAWFRGTADTVGWLRAADLAKTAAPAEEITWVGQWSTGDSSDIAITRDPHGGLHAVGDTVNMHRPSKPSGGFEGTLKTNGASGLYSDFDAAADARFKAQFPGETPPSPCIIRFRRVDRYLVVSDDSEGLACTGMGATFSGVYAR